MKKRYLYLLLRSGRILLFILDIVLILLIVLGSVGVWWTRQSLPTTSGKIFLPGLQRAVTVGRDNWGTPYIDASDMHDLLFAQGYATAQDRLFQMEISRRITQGRLAEAFGAGSNNEFIKADTLLRTLGIYRDIQMQIAHLSTETLAQFQAYTDGVNAFITTHEDHLPLEFSVLGIHAKAWTIADCVAVEANIALSLDNSWYYKYTRALVLYKIGPSLTSLLFPSYPTQNPVLLTDANKTTATPLSATLMTGKESAKVSTAMVDSINVLHTLLGDIGSSLGSNNWVVDGTKTVTGKPLLANDPHLNIGVPATWYEIALHAGGFNVMGFSLPGAPGVVIGHNASIAWGITNVGADTTDLYTEKLDPIHHPGKYFYNQHWISLQTRRELISVRGSNHPIAITIANTRDGPILNYAVDDLKHMTPVALKWTTLQPEYRVATFLPLDAATNWSQFGNALQSISLCQNFIYADVQGNIGYRMSGLLPIRSRDNSTLPVDGSTSQYEWQGFLPQQQMPMLFNPPSHMIVTANNQIVPATYPIYVTADWDEGYRARRISNLLAATPALSISDYERIQADVYSIPASLLTPYFITAGQQAHNSDTALAVRLLTQWNYTLARNSVGATIYEMTASTLLRSILEPFLGKNLYAIYQSNYSDSGFFTFLINTITAPNSPFFTAAGGDRTGIGKNAMIASALQNTVKQLKTLYGMDPSSWNWGKVHQAHFNHPLASIWPLNLLFGTTQLERPGDDETINIGGDDNFNADPASYDQLTVSSMREIIDLADFDNSLWIITTGESGQPLSIHYNDLNPLWDQNRYQSMLFSSQKRTRIIKEQLTLNPKRQMN